jgi:hypothetical protein
VQNGPDFGTAVNARPNVISVISARKIDEKKPVFFTLFPSLFPDFILVVLKPGKYYKNKQLKSSSNN